MWCRYLGGFTLLLIILHGVLYQVLWLNDAYATWKNKTLVYEYDSVSMLSGFIGWLGALFMALFTLPYIRRKFYLVRSSMHACNADESLCVPHIPAVAGSVRMLVPSR